MPRILIADPDPRTRQALALLLERRLAAVRIDEAWDHASLERQLDSSAPDTLLLDRYLPGLAAAEMSALARRRDQINLILMSVDADDLVVADALGVAFIYKGALPDEVLATLRTALADNLPAQQENS